MITKDTLVHACRSVLIIDDDAFSYQMISRILNKAGWDCHHAEHPEVARRLLSESQFTCIILDYRLPEIDGLTFLHELVDRPGPSPIIMITAEGNEMVAVEAFKHGAMDYLPKALLNPDSLMRVIQHVLEKQELLQELAHTQAQLTRMALFDSLTNLGNSGLFLRDLARAIAMAERNNDRFHIFMMDLNKFKAANDTYGHEAGDLVLNMTGQRLIASGRAADLFYRLGGDEFTAILPVPDSADIINIAKRVCANITQPYPWQEGMIYLGISIGIAVYPEHGSTPQILLRAADQAMYEAKRSGKDIAFAKNESGT